MAKIIEWKASAAKLPASVTVKVAQIMQAFDVLDHAVLSTSHSELTSAWHHSSRVWMVDGIKVGREAFEDHLTIWFKERAMLVTQRSNATILPMTRNKVSALRR